MTQILNIDRVEKPLLICHIIFKLDFGGLENGLVNLINHLPADRFCHVIISLKPATDFQNRISRSDVEIIEINKKDGKDLSAYKKVWSVIRKFKPDIVHTRNIPTLDMLVPAALSGVRRLIHSEHGLDLMELAGHHSKYNFLRRLSQLFTRRYITVSHDLENWLHKEIGIPKHKISLIYNGVDTEIFQPPANNTNPAPIFPRDFAPPRALVIGTIGRLGKVKDQVTLAHAFVRLIELCPNLRETARLVIVGDGELRSEIESILEAGGVSDLVWLPGFCSNTPEIYRSFNIFTLPSLREGISNTILEAMASGLPVIATNVGGNPEIVEDGVTGQLVPAANPEAIVSALQKYIDDPELAKVHGQAGHNKAMNKFSLTAMVQGYQKVYETL